jgi:hypothetical protein
MIQIQEGISNWKKQEVSENEKDARGIPGVGDPGVLDFEYSPGAEARAKKGSKVKLRTRSARWESIL